MKNNLNIIERNLAKFLLSNMNSAIYSCTKNIRSCFYFCRHDLTSVQYDFYADRRMLERNYDTMKKWMTFVSQHLKPDFTTDQNRYGDWVDASTMEENCKNSTKPKWIIDRGTNLSIPCGGLRGMRLKQREGLFRKMYGLFINMVFRI